MSKCIYQPAWSLGCNKEIGDGEVLCRAHQGKMCWCGATAVKECSMSGQFVCGRPTCADHECNCVAHGWTGSEGMKHSKKGYAQWLAWKADKEGEGGG